ncbi:MAG TPA: 6,7-dimethyl-8-ribityllumazine synthase [Steroidobacteraceae bacterium]|nr:6,7-dimethyl-8-ribityllumazine synthase [Steroidobacteraceae bacterium]
MAASHKDHAGPHAEPQAPAHTLPRAQGLSARGRRVAVAAARFNAAIVGSLIEGALAAWRTHGGAEQDLTLVRVPGAFELPVTAQALAKDGRYEAVIALGCVIRGDTPHFDFVAGECARGLAAVALETGVPVVFGVLTVNTAEQALERAAAGGMNKGGEALETALEMAELFGRLRQRA